MKYQTYDDLPGHLRRYVAKFGWPSDRTQDWLSRPIPVLADRSILQALEDGDVQSVNGVVLRVGDSLGITDGFYDD
jgi:hypothetical protein